jgi:PAS domain-containing protein
MKVSRPLRVEVDSTRFNGFNNTRVKPMQDSPLDDLKRLLSLLMDSVPLGVGVIDRDLRLQYVNEQQARLNGSSVAETVGRHIADIGPSLAAAAGPKIQFVLDTGVPRLGSAQIAIEFIASLAGSTGARDLK